MTRAFVWAGVLALFGLLAFAELDDDRKMIGAVFMAAAIAAVFYFVQTDVKKKRLRAAEGLLQEQAAAAKILQAASAELTDIRREMAKEDKKSDEVLALLSALSSAEFVLNGPDKTRKILA
jgi:hypothetical protein